MSDREAREAVLQRRVGATGEALAKMRAADEATPWRGCCRRCGATIRVDLISGIAISQVHQCG